ncbi:MAG: bifunctional (p)ppGpp synthetase/guanosine-3',5'-bis(diphosphate) 3'-pyrophosphohydrolase [Gammaproteobacteria bacterium]|nr:bifunctional (p)ppGpp synthetase/guanosine-3',5'-bis(diphosphate) 3'-pyrophosphohydrolase [Gammaproteobacteria bacterium]
MTQLKTLVEQLSQQTFKTDDDKSVLKKACEIAFTNESNVHDAPKGTRVALLLKKLGVDNDTILTALLAQPGLRESSDVDNLKKVFGHKISALVVDVNRLNALQVYNKKKSSSPRMVESLRRMLMAVVDDVRVVIIKLAYRIETLKTLKHADDEVRKITAQETMDVYAPLANWLGIGQLKWTLEDLSFRYLEADTYKQIASLLEERREDREQYVNDFVADLQGFLAEQSVSAKIEGRPKHIFSIWKKMQSKGLEFHELFDLRAVRVVVSSVADCYSVLGVVHTNWTHIQKEFDDYIANPKKNGYQSLHTAVIGPEGKHIEVQIRTDEMHMSAERGIASHWRYKQGTTLDRAFEKNISTIRDLVNQGEGEDISDYLDEYSTELFSDRVYVFTPGGEVIDLPKGATPLDFAYAIHTEVGHRCRGAKVDGRIVPLTTKLKNSEHVEIMRAKEGGPSRDWMNVHFGYIYSAHTRAKVRNWFNHQDLEKNIEDGRDILERTLARLNIHDVKPDALLQPGKRKNIETLFSDIGRGNISTAQISAWAHETTEPAQDEVQKMIVREDKTSQKAGHISVQGVGNLLTKMAKCCKPLPGDMIIGFITQGNGVTVHRRNCNNIHGFNNEQQQRLIEVSWGGSVMSTYPVDITINALDRTGLLSDITTTLFNEKINLIAANTHTDKRDQTCVFHLTIEIHNVEQLSQLIDRMNQLTNVFNVERSH